MAIDFPSNPVNGNTYSYLDVQYTYIQTPPHPGYWAVITPASYGVATPDEINEGTDNGKFTTSRGLEGSKYVREDEASGETSLFYNALLRLKALVTGVNVTGSLTENGVKVVTYDVGDIYLTMSSANPSVKYGGVWKLLTGGTQKACLVFGDGSAQSGVFVGDNNKTVPLPLHTHAGKVTGAGNHNHTYRKYPASNHFSGTGRPVSVNERIDHNQAEVSFTTGGDGGHTHGVTISSAGTNSALDTLGRHITINVWQRTA